MLGIIGGSGFYKFLDDAREEKIDTPYGQTSSPVFVGELNGKEVAFIARHGLNHQLPPHMVPYKANIFALKQLGVKRIIAPSAVGSLKLHIKPGSFVIPDQYVDKTKRSGTFFDGPNVTHINSSNPFCPSIRQIAIDLGRKMNLDVHGSGTAVIVEGPRFSTKVESKIYSNVYDCDIINMTIYPEVSLAKEMELCYASISIVTDYDNSIEEETVTTREVMKTFSENIEKVKLLIAEIISTLPAERHCSCKNALEGARF